MAIYLKQGARQSPERSREIAEIVSQILLEVEREGLPAIRRYSTRFDDWNPASFQVPAEAALAGGEQLSDRLRDDIDFACQQVGTFARLQLGSLGEFETETLPGITLGQRLIPVASAGSYSPGGRYPLIASSIMTIVVPKVAGVDRVVAAAPPSGGRGIYPAQAYTMALGGADRILCLGGVQAFAALAFGIEDIGPVDFIAGAGNAYVAEAKRQLFGRVGIDLLAGPTEVAAICDDSADPRLVAADLLGQAEHGPTSPATCIATSHTLGAAVLAAVDGWLAGAWPTKEIAGAAWRDYGSVIVCADDEEAARVSDHLAPEHLEVQTADPDWYLGRLRNYGSLFLGRDSTVAYSDKAIGTNHVLPTGTAARYTGGLWVGKFLKTVTYQKVTPEGSRHVAGPTAGISDAEHMSGHALTARLRLDSGLLAGSEHAEQAAAHRPRADHLRSLRRKAMPRIERLGHVGIYCSDLAKQADFYSRVLGLTITDRDGRRGLVFLSARPEEEDHELLLAAGRNVGRDAQVIQQVSFRCASLSDVRGFHGRLVAEGAEIDVIVSHGVAVGVYFYDPEGNRVEVYYATGIDAPQPHVIGIDITQDDAAILASVQRGVAEHPGAPFIDETVFAGQHIGAPPS